jgi:hypothetical protein
MIPQRHQIFAQRRQLLLLPFIQRLSRFSRGREPGLRFGYLR